MLPGANIKENRSEKDVRQKKKEKGKGQREGRD